MFSYSKKRSSSRPPEAATAPAVLRTAAEGG